jgi:hypothetical protein
MVLLMKRNNGRLLTWKSNIIMRPLSRCSEAEKKENICIIARHVYIYMKRVFPGLGLSSAGQSGASSPGHRGTDSKAERVPPAKPESTDFSQQCRF